MNHPTPKGSYDEGLFMCQTPNCRSLLFGRLERIVATKGIVAEQVSHDDDWIKCAHCHVVYKWMSSEGTWVRMSTGMTI